MLMNLCGLLAAHVRQFLPSKVLALPQARRPLYSIANGELSVAVVGSGPAGFYFTDRLCRLLGARVRIDILDELPTPFGLVRSGVAPDHPDTKKVTRRFEATACRPNVRFFGGVAVGAAVSLEELQAMYNCVVLAYGASGDKRLDVAGEDASGCFSAREFVNWYNGHPHFTHLPVNLSKVTSVGIVGLGNVALDCARILLRPVKALEGTDISDHALHELRHSSVSEVHIIGRRGPLQTQFSGKELREVLTLENVSVTLHPEDYNPTDIDLKEPRKNQRCMAAMQAAHGKAAATVPERHLHLHFLQMPCAVQQAPSGHVAALELYENALCTDATGTQALERTGATSAIPMQLLLKSVGYRAAPLPGLPFDERYCVVPNRIGRVLQNASRDAEAVVGVYVCGWLKRGATGIIGTNLADAEQTARCVEEDVAAGILPLGAPASRGDALPMLLKSRGVSAVTWDHWLQIDAAEKAAGLAHGKPRSKLCSIQDMLATAGLP